MIKAVRGTRDILPPSSAVWNHVEQVAREVFRTYNYGEIRTPIFEVTELFARGVGRETDIVSKEMYTWTDRDDSSLTLRPENTASVIRACIEHRLDQQPGLKKLYYLGPMFRRERPQKGRYRQFSQIGAEVVGGEAPAIDAEVIEMVLEILTRCGVQEPHLIINSVGCPKCRPAFIARLREAMESVKGQLCEDCRRRVDTNPLRVLDCKVPEDQDIINALPSILDHLGEECATHFAAVRELLDVRGIGYEVRPRLVRGLDYYTRTVFEFVSTEIGAQGTVCGGGRYDGLVKEMGGPDMPSLGFAMGLERLLLLMDAKKIEIPEPEPCALYIAGLGEKAQLLAFKLVRDVRSASLYAQSDVAGRGLKAQMKYADKYGAQFSLVLGDS
jgi:histidyl-tRNA synthetase